MGKYDRKKYRQIIMHINTKQALDKIKAQKDLASYNDTILLLIKHFNIQYD